MPNRRFLFVRTFSAALTLHFPTRIEPRTLFHAVGLFPPDFSYLTLSLSHAHTRGRGFIRSSLLRLFTHVRGNLSPPIRIRLVCRIDYSHNSVHLCHAAHRPVFRVYASPARLNSSECLVSSALPTRCGSD
ncbi:unnamed protein product [Protopolystoma xenopodis]|uniref:Uncharacterized protein n=1 Tax=Protopolystoma xenopodis TaxID=117903 RepID=A0A3S4ZZ35_9PLAT|nr:unnamed protein product [Protopolystoma xenopodis]